MGWIIAGSIFVFILLLTLGRVKIIFDYKDDVIFKVKYMFLPLVTIPATKPKKQKPPKKEKKSKKKTEGEDEEEKSEDEKPEEKKPKKKISLADIFEILKLVLDSLGKPLKRILKRTIFAHLALRISVGGEDAAKTAIKFGLVNMAVGNALGWLDTAFTLKKPDDINITADFQSEETKIDCYCEISLVAAAAFAFLFTFIGRAIKYYFTHNRTRAAIRNLV
ncbi:MAG: DUF2953 domain-containing protein [Oscillospiraceae bacterium]|nr:DUF2953 domain-containing protein [Oscillospiraceae bacterium]